MNSVDLIGRTVRDPEIRYTAQSQTAVANFTLAVDKNFKKDKDEPANFISIVCFGKTAEFVEKFVRKGKRVGIYNGEITTGSYEKDGRKVFTTDVVAGKVEVIDWPEKDGERRPQETREAPARRADSFEEIQEEVPF